MRKKSLIRKIIAEELRRVMSEGASPSQDSLDDQIDSLLIKYERDSIVDAPADEDIALESKSLMSVVKFLMEAPEDEEEEEEIPATDIGDEPDPAPALDTDVEDEDEDMTVGSEDMTVDEPREESQPKIDIDVFTSRVSRLIFNLDTLLNPRDVVITRAKNYLSNNSNPATADEFEEILRQQFGVESSMTRSKNDFENEQPLAVGAGPGLGGGGGPI